MDALADRGHNLTVVSSGLKLQSRKNIHYIHMEKAFDILQNMNFDDMSNDNIFTGLMAGYDYNILVAEGFKLGCFNFFSLRFQKFKESSNLKVSRQSWSIQMNLNLIWLFMTSLVDQFCCR